MPTARQAYLINVLKKKHKVIGVVVARYIEAGYSVSVGHPTRYGPISILARKEREILVVEVFDKGVVTLDQVKICHEKTKVLRAKLIIILYGSDVKLSEEARTYCLDNGIKVRRVLAE